MSDPETNDAEAQASPEGEVPATESVEAAPEASPAGAGDAEAQAATADAESVSAEDESAIAQQIANLPPAGTGLAPSPYMEYLSDKLGAALEHIKVIRAAARRAGVATDEFEYPEYTGS